FDLLVPAEPTLAATLPNIVFAFPSWTPSNILRCPRNRVNSSSTVAIGAIVVGSSIILAAKYIM
ncbi:MAG TPA: hypothetical protein VGQ21_06250, partial [Thermoanaerobaculia bacterium]|nr:hypothetical protein [Thermoanaerobaculia bacterium]